MSDTPEMSLETLSEELQKEQPQQEQVQKNEPAKQPKAKKVKKPWPVPVRILMGFIAFILCIVMFVVSVVGVLILNVRTVVSRDGIHKIVTQLVSGPTASGPVRPALAVGVDGYQNGYSADGDMSGMLVDWVYDRLKESFGEGMTATREQVQTFVEESTVKDFVIDKVAGLVEDFYAGTSETTITTAEITQMIEENKEIIESQFGVVINQEALDAVDTMLEESGIMEPLEEQGLMGYIEQSMSGSQKPVVPDVEGDTQESTVGGTVGGEEDGIVGDGNPDDTQNTVGQENPMDSVRLIMDAIRTATSYEAVAALGGVFVLLMLLLFVVTHFSFPATLADTGVVLLLTGLIYGLPTAYCMFAPEMVSLMLGEPAGGIVSLIFGAAAGVNFTVLGLGFALIVAAIVVKIILSVKAKKA